MGNTHLSGPLSVEGGAYESLITTKQLSNNDNGKTFGLNLDAGFTVTLPKLADVSTGWVVRVRVEIKPGAGNYIISEHADEDNSILGGMVSSSGNLAAAAFEVNGTGSLSLIAAISEVGDWLSFENNGANWIAYGQSTVPTAFVFAPPN